MGILPLQFKPGESALGLGLDGEEVYSIEGLPDAIAGRFAQGRELVVTALRPGQGSQSFSVSVRIDTPQEIRYYEHGGILPYVLRQLLHAGAESAGPEQRCEPVAPRCTSRAPRLAAPPNRTPREPETLAHSVANQPLEFT